jgi:Protein of unknown function (DUF732)
MTAPQSFSTRSTPLQHPRTTTVAQDVAAGSTGVSEMASTRICKPGPLLSLLAAGLLLAVAQLGLLGAAPTVHAETTDNAFVQALRDHGITDSPQSAIVAGHLVCRELDMGRTQEQIATDVMNSSSLDADNAGYFVAVAERAYCPQYAS